MTQTPEQAALLRAAEMIKGQADSEFLSTSSYGELQKAAYVHAAAICRDLAEAA